MAPLSCHHWHELSEDEKRAIKDTSENPDRDYSLISVIDGLKRNEQENLYKRLFPNSSTVRAEYNNYQLKWLGKEKEYLAWRTNRHQNDVPEMEFIKDMEQLGTFYRYRLYYVGKKYLEGKFEDFLIRLDNASVEDLEIVTDFFEDIREAYDYVPTKLNLINNEQENTPDLDLNHTTSNSYSFAMAG